LCKAAFYARVALQAAPPRSRGSAQQSLGVVLLARGQYREALTHLRGALADWPTDKAPRALCLSALAYLWSLMGDRREAGRAIEATLFHCSHLGAYPSFYRRDVHLSLGFSRLELGDAEGALGDAVRALRLLDTEAPGSRHEHKMALYLAAESALDAGFIDSGLHYADQLQQTYYPGRRDIRGLLAAFRTSGMVNWLA
jgi:tetratricopeptide (TPR) repeat protein